MINEINKIFEPAFAKYIITALADGATVSDSNGEPKMMCPYQTRVIHTPERDGEYIKHCAEDITEFGLCHEERCPLYYEVNDVFHKTKMKGCRRADKEGT